MYPRILVSVFVAVIGVSLGGQLPRDILAGGGGSRASGPAMGRGMVDLKNELAARKYLKNYGYLEVSSAKTMTDEGNRTAAIIRFQEYMGLPVTSTLDEDTMAVINHPRCGVVDPVDSHQPFPMMGGKWNKSEITYRIQGSVPGYTRQQLAAVVQEAFDVYAPHVPLTFTLVRTRSTGADIVVNFRSQTDDLSMDGEGKSVGWTYPPLADSGHCGEINIDADEDYTTADSDGTPLLAVIAHQIGHALGLGHTSSAGSVMQPCVPAYTPDLHLHAVDIDALQQLYGDGNTELAIQNVLCTMTSYDAVTVMDGDLYVFKGDRFWELTTTGSLLSPSEGVLISSVWPEVGDDVDVVFKNSLGHVVIVKGGKYYEYDVTGILFPWAPESTRTMRLPKNAEAGYSIYQSSFFMRSGKLWFMDEVSRSVHPDSPKSIRKLWKISLDNVDSAFLLNDYLYVLDGQDYIRLEASTTHLDEAGPRNFGTDFLGC